MGFWLLSFDRLGRLCAGIKFIPVHSLPSQEGCFVNLMRIAHDVVYMLYHDCIKTGMSGYILLVR